MDVLIKFVSAVLIFCVALIVEALCKYFYYINIIINHSSYHEVLLSTFLSLLQLLSMLIK